MHEWRSFQLNTLPTYVLGIEYSIVTPVADYSLPNNCGRSKEDEQERAKKYGPAASRLRTGSSTSAKNARSLSSVTSVR